MTDLTYDTFRKEIEMLPKIKMSKEYDTLRKVTEKLRKIKMPEVAESHYRFMNLLYAKLEKLYIENGWRW
ncbi:MAG: hypothetical protein V3V84_00755 [Candidatus Bathyarchaeia archaeon]